MGRFLPMSVMPDRESLWPLLVDRPIPWPNFREEWRLAAGEDCRSLPRSVADGELYVGNAELFTYGEHLGDMLKTALGVGMNGHL